MDKYENSYTYVLPRYDSSTQFSSKAGSDQARAANSSQARSFDNALDRIRDRMVAQQQGVEKQQSVMDVASDASHADVVQAGGVQARAASEQIDAEEMAITSNEDETSEEILNELSNQESIESPQQDEVSWDAQSVVDQHVMPPVDSLLIEKNADVPLPHSSETTARSIEPSQVVMSDSVHGEVHATTSVSSNESAFHSVVNAENIATMMLRMERAAGAHAGQWSFSVLDNPLGVSALKMQRSAEGNWTVGISLNQTNEADDVKNAEGLKNALLSKGHKVDAVTVTHL